MAAIESLGIDPVNMPEASGEITVRGLDQEVIVVGHETIGGDAKMPEFAGFLDGLEEGLVILCVPKNRFPPSSSVEDMIPGMGILDTKRPRHELTIFEKRI
jgi:hypothetical protein